MVPGALAALGKVRLIQRNDHGDGLCLQARQDAQTEFWREERMPGYYQYRQIDIGGEHLGLGAFTTQNTVALWQQVRDQRRMVGPVDDGPVARNGLEITTLEVGNNGWTGIEPGLGAMCA